MGLDRVALFVMLYHAPLLGLQCLLTRTLYIVPNHHLPTFTIIVF